MHKQQIRHIVETITGERCPPDDVEIPMSSLQQLEFFFAIEDETNFRHTIGEVNWQTVNDVIKWLEERGEYEAKPTGVRTE